jgi:hypothetical protein
MIVVIQCQGRKRPDAGRLQTADGRPVNFVAQPGLAPSDAPCLYARPDDPSNGGRPWRQALLDYNNDGRNPFGLYPAYQLYSDELYRRLADRVGVQNLYILSAGWGLIRAEFLTPYYDITFSQTKKDQKFKRRRKSDGYHDFAMLPAGTCEPILFFGSQSYVASFCTLTKGSTCEKTVFYNTAQAPDAPGCMLKRFENAKRDTNWQFDCANAFLEGTLRVE